MSEEKWALDTPDGFKIYGLLNKPDKKKNDKVILHVHGLGGCWNDYASTRMALTFPKKGYDIIRMNLYWWEKGARSLIDCTIKQHAIDIDLVFKYFKRKYKKVFATGHSYGGPSLMSSKINQFDGVSLWDPSYIPQISVAKKDYTKSGKYYISLDSSTLVLSKEFIDEASQFNRKYAEKLSQKCKTPLQVIYGDKESFWIGKGASFHTHAKGPTDEKIISKSQHCFFEDGSTEPLLRYTKKWFDQF